MNYSNNTYFSGSFKVSRLGFGIYESLSGVWLESSDPSKHKVTSIDVGSVDDFGNILAFSDDAGEILAITFKD